MSDAPLVEETVAAQPPRPGTTYAAVLWDMDGTLVDTEPYWMAAETRLAERFGGEWTHDDALAVVGFDLLDAGAYIRDRLGIDLEPARIVDLMLEDVIEQVRAAVPWREGARELLADLGSAGVPCGLVTMSYLSFVEPILEHLAPDTFAAIVTGDAVERGKPYPEPYLEAARRLGVDAADCLAIEDSNTGATSAERAGCVVLCIPNHVAVADGERRVFADSLVGLGAANLPGLG